MLASRSNCLQKQIVRRFAGGPEGRGGTRYVYSSLQLLIDKGYWRVLDSSADDVTGYFAVNGCTIESAPKQRK